MLNRDVMIERSQHCNGSGSIDFLELEEPDDQIVHHIHRTEGQAKVPHYQKRLPMSKTTVSVIECIICHEEKIPYKFCSCRNGHKICGACIRNEVQEFLLGDRKVVKINCLKPDCKVLVPIEELSKVLSPFTVKLIEKKVDKDYLEYIKSWLFTSFAVKLKSREEFILSSDVFKEVSQKVERWPPYWEPMKDDQQEYRMPFIFLPHYRGEEHRMQTTVYVVKQDSDEYAVQARSFHESLEFPDYEIINLFRIQNPIMWKFYNLKRSQMQNEQRVPAEIERRLYHGTVNSVIGTIAEKGFDWRLCGKNATVYGQGTYFAKSARTSHNYTYPESPSICCSKCKKRKRFKRGIGEAEVISPRPKSLPAGEYRNVLSVFEENSSGKTHFMFVAHVLVGQFTVGTSSLRRPPPVDKQKPHGRLYDSCVDNLDNPEKFVIFDHTQAYPLYVVEYTAPK